MLRVLQLDDTKAADEAIAGGAYRNTRQVLKALHDPDSTLLDDLRLALRNGKLCVLDLSLFRARAQALLGIVLNSIFEHNMRELTTEKADVVPVIAVIEEAHNVLNGNETDVTRPFIEFAKEGRKFHCGIFGITQQPGMIDDEILSQGDNFFVFHLLSEGDLTALRKANPHFSTDLLSSLLNEPLVGSGYFFSLYSSKQYPIPFRPFDFTKRYSNRLGDQGALNVYASRLQLAAQERRRQSEPDKARAVAAAVQKLVTDRGFLKKCLAGEAKHGHSMGASRGGSGAHSRKGCSSR